MSDSPLIVKSKAFALEVIQVCKTYFLNNPPKTENEKYAYDINGKAYNFLTQKEGVSNNDY